MIRKSVVNDNFLNVLSFIGLSSIFLFPDNNFVVHCVLFLILCFPDILSDHILLLYTHRL